MYHHWGHGTSTPAVGSATSGSRIDSPSQSPSQSSYQMSQMRWLPSMITRSATHSHNSLPTISSNFRLGQQQQQQQQEEQQQQQQQPQHHAHHHHPHSHPHHPHHHQHHHHHQQQQQGQPPPPVSVVLESRAPPASSGQQTGARGAPELVESEESDRSDSPGETPGARDVGGVGDPDFAPSPGEHGRQSTGRGRGGRQNLAGRGDEDLDDREGMSGGVGESGESTSGGGTGMREGPDTLRKHGKRLTTKEEVCLFEICNRHAAGFGQRSNLCKWWMTVTMEFTRGQKHPYSWHSVRRKVEIVTKQRMKFLEEQREKGVGEGEDLSNPRWRAVVDAWIPTWQRWEEAEARRIEKRDSRRPRKRKWIGDGWETPQADSWRAPSSSSPLVNHTPTPNHPHNHNHSHPVTPMAPTPPVVSTPVRLPPGFDNMFSGQTTTSTPNNPNHPSSSNTTGTDSTMMAAVLETLGKLNKHLDAANPDSRSSFPPTSEARATTANSLNRSSSQSHSNIDDGSGVGSEDPPSPPLQPQLHLSSTLINKLKAEIRREMRNEFREEWEKERASLEEKLDSVQRTQEMILEMLRQEPT
ncbi:hypothetical protein P175DRAFT_0501491 [Aspergillus ochraceoroseus IBT 24754]|uniref:Uncharacterized protein n=3 Tax=Aspergillus subgen. Nidulantes TaxID=2720870 RepID=A0A0F8XB39_9EURO|nr:uncharacterized protein P175DRAFT_0501491 [Aspergillus ochraceoroseus IBT 24754]KKK12441.1 hypothetical protein AOCH_000421 [Aspergillus ochraceoroseus]KKK26760.1 hypothetical protein ARAM_000394 [Aspergillus rambellii]PTU20855.1 hypothetical protein P175DRAFT_0501491 [Aspergillus ochraceoroseus IBT 24754]